MYKPDTWYAKGSLVFLVKPSGKLTGENAIHFNIWHEHNLPVDMEAKQSVHDLAEALADILNQIGATDVKNVGKLTKALVAHMLRVQMTVDLQPDGSVQVNEKAG